jgi:anti-sigma-K factor RskA
MNERIDHEMFDEVAVYALGVLPAGDAARVRAHIATCPQCQDEYARLRSTVALVGVAAETSGDARTCPSTLLKPRIMAQIRKEGARPAAVTAAQTGPKVWPAYLVAAACLAIAIVSSIANIAMTGQIRQMQTDLARSSSRATTLAARLNQTQTTVADLLSGDAKHYDLDGGQVVTRGSHVYIAMRALAQPPRGKVYQAWTLAKGAKRVAPSLTFVPDAHGVAVVALPVDARSMAAVAVSVEPEGGSKQPTTKPIAIVPLT